MSERRAHLVDLGAGFSLWREFALRGAGFPAQLARLLSAPELSELEAQLSASTAAEQRAREEAIATCRRLRAEGDADPLLVDVLAALGRGGALPAALPSNVAVRAVLEKFRSDALALEELTAEVERRHDAEWTREDRALRELASGGDFLCALIWQNRSFVENGLKPLLRRPEGAQDSKTRQKQAALARYLYRYSLKNDTIGFFGPLGWGQFDGGERAAEVKPGPSLIEWRQIFFEPWAVEAISRAIAQTPGLAPHLSPRRVPTIHLDGQKLVLPTGESMELDPHRAALLAACDGETRAADIAKSAADEAQLAEFVRDGWIAWDLATPAAIPYPEEVLRGLIERVQDPELRKSSLSVLDGLVQHRARIQAATGDAAKLDAALGAFTADFTKVTGAEASRRAGQVYAGRTPLYEDARRDLRATFGQPVLEKLSAPLSLIGLTARWYTYEIGRRYYDAFEETLSRLEAQTGKSIFDAATFQKAALPLFPWITGQQMAPHALGQVVTDAVRTKWAELVNAPEGAKEVRRTSAELRAAVESSFAAPHPGWPSARHQCPDILISASSVEAIQSGDYFVVLGEVHSGLNTLEWPAAVFLHPQSERLFEALSIDVPGRMAPIFPKDRMTRATFTSFAPDADHFAFDPNPSPWPAEKTFPLAGLVVERIDGRVCVRTRDGKKRWDIIQYYDWRLGMQSHSFFHLLPKARHQPRVFIDDVVIARESWRFTGAELPFLKLNGSKRFFSAVSWRKAHGIPAAVFAKASTEMKPFFVDFDSPMSLQAFAQLAADAESITLSELLPSFDQLWLEDAKAQKYSCELRIVLRDQERWRAPQRG